MIEVVSVAYNKYPHHKINWTWLTLLCCFNQIITHHGDNDYNIDHIRKEQLERNGNLPDVMDVVEDVEEYATTILLMMMKVRMMQWMMKTQLFLHKPKRIPILPTCKWEDGDYSH